MKADSDSVYLEWGLRVWISNHFPSDADVAGLQMTFVQSGAGAAYPILWALISEFVFAANTVYPVTLT